MQTADQPLLVFVFVRGLEAIQDQRIGGRVLRVVELGEFPGDRETLEYFLTREDKAKGGAVVEDTYFEREFAPQARVLLKVYAGAIVVVPRGA